MYFVWKYFTFLVLISSPLEGGVAAEYITKPRDLNISVGEDAIFACEFHFRIDYVAWYLSGTPVQNYPDLYVQQLVNLSRQPVSADIRISVTSEAMPILNNSLVQCQGLNVAENIFKLSFPAKLLVQGLLEAPADLTAAFFRSKLLLQWLSPYTLTGVKIKGYQIQSSIMGDHTDDAISLSETAYNNSCINYQICVQALTAAGLGNASCVISNRTGVLGSLHDRSLEIMVFSHPNIIPPLDHENFSCIADQSTEQSILDFSEWAEFDISNYSSLVPHFHDNASLGLNLSLPTMMNSSYITTSISFYNLVFHVVNLTITRTESGYEFECDLVKYSTATGCIVKIECKHDTSESYELYVVKDTSSTLKPNNLNCSLVTILGFDAYSNGTNPIPSKIIKNFTLDYGFLQTTSTPALIQVTTLYTSTSSTSLQLSPTTTQLNGVNLGLVISLLGLNGLLVVFMCTVCILTLVYHRRRVSKGHALHNMYQCNTVTNVWRHSAENVEKHGVRRGKSSEAELRAVTSKERIV